MKTIALLFLMTCIVPELWGQKVEYYYDAAGNRHLRKVISMNKSAVSGSEGESGYGKMDNGYSFGETPPPERYEDMLGERKVLIYPNPTQGILRIDFQGYGNLKDARLLLYDIQGKPLQQVNKVDPSVILDLSLYPSGMYILRMLEGNAKSEWKIVKE